MQYERNVDIIRRMQSGLIYQDIRGARTGKKDSAYTGGVNPDPTIDLADGYIWVREGENGDRGQTVAIIVGIRSDIADIPILIGERVIDGALCAIQPDINPKTLAQYGGSLPATGVPNTPDEWQRQPVATLYLSAGRIRPSVINPDTLYVYIEPFMHNGRWYGGIDHDVGSANVPGNTNEARWVIVTLDDDNTSYSKAGTLVTIAELDQLQTDNDTYGLNSITIPAGQIPVGAVSLVTGQTAIKESRFEDPRYWIEPRGTLLSEDAETLTIATGVITAGSGSNFIVAAESGTSDDLATITMSGIPRVIMLQADSGDTITVKHGTGNISLNGGQDFAMSGDKTLALFYDGTNLSDTGAGQGTTVEYSSDDVTNPPTQEELTTAYGNPWDIGPNFLGLLDDNNGGTKEYAVFSDGIQFLFTPLTVARSELATDALVRQGTVLEAIDGETDNVYEPVVLYEGDPVILTDAPRVFKMWFGRGWGSGASIGVSYAESYDGVTWTRYGSNPLITSHFRPALVKSGSTYYLYASEEDNEIDLYTSSDGVTFSLSTSGVIQKGAGGAWDNFAIANSHVWIEGATWYMLYEGRQSGGAWKLGLATSADGITWAKSGSNPVVNETGMRGGPFVHKVGSTYWLLCQGATSGNLPTDIYRYHSSNLTSWTADGTYITRTGVDEGEGEANGQVADPHAVFVNGVMYLWYEGTSDGTTSAGAQHIKLITGKTSLLTD